MRLMPKRLYQGSALALSLAALAIGGFAARPQAQGGQQPAAPPAPPAINQSADPLLKSFRFRSIGPASMGGRIDDIAVSESEPEHHLSRLRRRRRVQVGEQRRHVRAGVRDLQHRVDRRHRHPSDQPEHRLRRHRRGEQPPDHVVRRRRLQDDRRRQDLHQHRPEGDAGDRAHRHRSEESRDRLRRVAGPLFGPNKERGIYKTTDGGKTWNQIKFIDDDTGFTDIVLDPVNPEHHLRGELPAPPHGLLLQRRRARAAGSGRPPTRARRGRSVTGSGLPPGHRTAASRSTCRARIRTSSTRRSKRATSAGRCAPDPVTISRRREATPAGAAAVPQPGQAGPPAAGRGQARRQPRRSRSAAAAGGRRRRRRLQLVQQRRTRARLRRRARRRQAGQRRDRRRRRRSNPATRRHLPLRGQGPDVDAREQLQLASDVLQPDPRRSVERQDDLRRRPAGREVARRRQDVRDARRGRRQRRSRPRRSARDLDRSEEPEAHPGRQRRRPRHQLGPGQDVGLR